jgi:hypothetical protein
LYTLQVTFSCIDTIALALEDNISRAFDAPKAIANSTNKVRYLN